MPRLRLSLTCFAAAAILTACGSPEPDTPEPIETKSETPLCDRLIELGQFDRFERVDLPAGDTADAIVSSFLKPPERGEPETFALNRNVIGGCIVYQGHAKGMPEDDPAAEMIRMAVVEPDDNDEASVVVAAGVRSICRAATPPQWSPGDCRN